MAEPFEPLIAGFWLGFFKWIFILLALGSTIWFLTYISSSKRRIAKTTFTAFVITIVFTGIALQLIMVGAGITFF